MADGLMWAGALAQGLQQGISAYQRQRSYEDDKKKDKALLELKADEQGKTIDPETFEVKDAGPSQKDRKNRRDERIKILGLMGPEAIASNPALQKEVQNLYNDTGPQAQPVPKLGAAQNEPLAAAPLAAERAPQIEQANPFSPGPGYRSKSQRGIEDYVAKGMALETAKRNFGAQVPAEKAADVGRADSSLKKVNDLRQMIKENSSTMGPVAGRLASHNPYNATGGGIDAQTMAAIQDIGTYLEGGKLADKDIPKYQKILPSINDIPEVANKKLDLMEKLIIDKQQAELGALKGAGFRTGGIKGNKAAPKEEKKEGLLSGGWTDEKEKRLKELREKMNASQ